MRRVLNVAQFSFVVALERFVEIGYRVTLKNERGRIGARWFFQFVCDFGTMN